MGVSRALGEVVPALDDLDTQPETDRGQRMRRRRQELGLLVMPAGKELPLHATQLSPESPDDLAELDPEPPEAEAERAAWRLRLAERRMREAYLAPVEAEQCEASPRVLEQVMVAFDQTGGV
jgi:hypothetical protein